MLLFVLYKLTCVWLIPLLVKSFSTDFLIFEVKLCEHCSSSESISLSTVGKSHWQRQGHAAGQTLCEFCNLWTLCVRKVSFHMPCVKSFTEQPSPPPSPCRNIFTNMAYSIASALYSPLLKRSGIIPYPLSTSLGEFLCAGVWHVN